MVSLREAMIRQVPHSAVVRAALANIVAAENASQAATDRKITAVADRYRVPLAKEVKKDFVTAKNSVDLAALELLFANGNEESVNQYLDTVVDKLGVNLLRVSGSSALSNLMLTIAESSGNATRRMYPGFILPEANTAVLIAFDRTNPLAVEWAESRSAKLVVEVSAKTRLALRTIVSRAYADGIPPAKSSRLIREVVGLTELQANAVVNLHQTILTSPGKLVHAGKVAIRVPKSGMKDAQLKRALESYANRLLNQRAMNIARTETIASANEGQLQLWKQNVAKGLLPATIQRVWIAGATERTCPQCRALDGVTTTLDGTFDGIANPPAHPRCRCTTGLVQ